MFCICRQNIISKFNTPCNFAVIFTGLKYQATVIGKDGIKEFLCQLNSICYKGGMAMSKTNFDI